jgi:hypothetical protein
MAEQVTALELRPPQTLPAEEKSKKRAWSAGETVFNYGVYGGVSWIVNEIISTAITYSIYPEHKSLKSGNPSLLKRIYTPNGAFYQPFERTVDFLHKHVNPMQWGRRIHYLAAEMFVMCLGGSLLVPPVRYLEGKKGSIVRWLDRTFHGGKDDPKLEALHKEMDSAPQQSWSTLWKGRFLVLSAAIGMHFVMGAENDKTNDAEHKRWIAPTTHLFKGTFMEKYSNLSRAMQTLTRDILRWVHPNADVRNALTKFRFPDAETLAQHGVEGKGTFIPIHSSEGKWAAALGNTFGYVLSVSAAVAVLFFVSTRMFAAARDKVKPRQDNTAAADTTDITLNAPMQDAALADDQPKKEDIKGGKPATTIGKASHELTLNSAPTHEVAHAG